MGRERTQRGSTVPIRFLEVLGLGGVSDRGRVSDRDRVRSGNLRGGSVEFGTFTKELLGLPGEDALERAGGDPTEHNRHYRTLAEACASRCRGEWDIWAVDEAVRKAENIGPPVLTNESVRAENGDGLGSSVGRRAGSVWGGQGESERGGFGEGFRGRAWGGFCGPPHALPFMALYLGLRPWEGRPGIFHSVVPGPSALRGPAAPPAMPTAGSLPTLRYAKDSCKLKLRDAQGFRQGRKGGV